MENYFKISDFEELKKFTNHKLPLNNYQTGRIHVSLSNELIKSENTILDKLFKISISKIQNHILEEIFSSFKLTLREDFVDVRFNKEMMFHFELFNLNSVIIGRTYFLRVLEYLISTDQQFPFLSTLNETENSYLSESMGLHGVSVYHLKPNLNKNIQIETSQFYSFDEICFDICDFKHYISNDYSTNLVNLQVSFKYYINLINACKFFLIENESSKNYIKFLKQLRDNKISKILYD